MNTCWSSCRLTLYLCIPWGPFSPKFPQGLELPWQQATRMLPPPFPPPWPRRQLPLPEGESSLLGSSQEPVLTGRAEGGQEEGGVRQPGTGPCTTDLKSS